MKRTAVDTMQYPMMLRISVLVAPNSGSAQKGWMALVMTSPAVKAMATRLNATRRRDEDVDDAGRDHDDERIEEGGRHAAEPIGNGLQQSGISHHPENAGI